jgi:excisionase family DNA binding protein
MGTHSLTPPTDEAIALEALLTINDVARLLGVSRATVYETRAGELVPIRVGQRARFEPSDVRAYLERNRDGSEP